MSIWFERLLPRPSVSLTGGFSINFNLKNMISHQFKGLKCPVSPDFFKKISKSPDFGDKF
jgi:hypothetical protein